MAVLKLGDVAVGDIKGPRQWSNEEQRMVPLDPLQTFIDRLTDKKHNYKTNEYSQTLFCRFDNIGEGQAFHKNYMEYLEICWGDHLGIVVSPDILWYILLCELTQIVKANPEQYRPLFSESEEKQEIIIFTDELVVMPLDELVEALKSYVPTDMTPFMPEFSTLTDRGRHAQYAAFCDMCSPYYDYGMLLCGFPAIEVRGTVADWELMLESWKSLKDKFQSFASYFVKVQTAISNIIANQTNPEFWKGMFSLQKCGSGSQVLVDGWINDLYLETPPVRYPKNYSSNVSVVKYKQLNTQKNYEMNEGLFFSRMNGDILVPEYGSVVLEKVEE